MIKKLFIILLLWIFVLPVTFAEPFINCGFLPFCDTNRPTSTTELGHISIFISELIKNVALIAVIALMISGVMYLVSGGEEEKVKRAKTWIIWSLVGTLLSVSSWAIIQVLNTLVVN